LSLQKPKPKSFLMLVVLTLHQAWPLCFLSMSYICPKCLVGCHKGESPNKMSPLNLVGK
jgi:hypothetical protein